MQESTYLRNLLRKDPKKTSQIIASMPNDLALLLLYDWNLWARDKQMLPPGDWDTWLIKAGRGFGKMIDVDTDIKTISGWKKMGDICPGDIVFNNDGDPVPVLFVYDIEEKPAYKLTFDTGESIIACEDHLWYTITKLEYKQIRRGKLFEGSIKTTKQIAETIKYKIRETNHRIPITKPIFLPHCDFIIHPYLLGAWLGDGASNAGEITCAENEIVENLRQLGYSVNHVRDKLQHTIDTKPSVRCKISGRFTSNDSFYSKLKQLNLIKNKHIPDDYLNGSISQRMDLLRGLMDTDGYCDTAGHCEFVSIKKELAEDVLELILSLGIKAKMYDSESTFYGKSMGRKYRIFFKTDKTVFNLKRKIERQRGATTAQLSMHESRFIIKAEPVEKTKMRCIKVDSDDGIFLITKSFIATHNSRAGAETVRMWARDFPIINIVSATASDARDIMVEGESGILAISPDYERPEYLPSKRKLTWPNGSKALIYSADQPDRLRGPQCYKAWADELAAWRYPDAWDQLQFGLRLGSHPQCIVTTTPRPTKIIKDIISDEKTIITEGSTYENKENLAESFIRSIERKYEGTRLGKQEIFAEMLTDVEGALWSYAIISYVKRLPELSRIVIAIDPAVTNTAKSNETGIVVCGLGVDGIGYVLDDLSGIYSPNQWGQIAVKLYYKWRADRVVAEVNQGGDMVEAIIRNIDPDVAYKKVRASRGKRTRAEPIAAFYEQGRVKHYGSHSELEMQMTSWDTQTEDSPDRIDALVWGFTELMIKRELELEVDWN